MKCPGLHCPGCGDGGGGALIALVVVIIIAAIAGPVASAADELLTTVIHVLEVVAIVIGSVLGLGVLGGMAWAAHRVHRWQATRRQAIPNHARTAQRLSGPQNAAVEAPRKVIPLTVITEKTVRAKGRNTP